jgi:ankyrin repeat protein
LQCRSSQDGTDKIKTLLTSIPASDLDTLRADNGLTALEIAVDRKNLLAIRLRVEHGVNPNNATPGFTLAIDVIHVAAERGNLELTQLLINRGIDLNVSPNGGNTPLMLAAWKGHLAIVKLMVKNGARLGLGSAGGRNVLMAAMQTGKLDVIRFLLDANKSASDPFDINQQDESGHTTLSLAYVKHGSWRRNASENEKDVRDTIFLLQNTEASKDFLLSRHDTGYGFPYSKSCIERAARAGLGEEGDRDAKIAFVDAVKAFYHPNDTSYLSLLKNIPVKTRYEEAQDAKRAYLYDRH